MRTLNDNVVNKSGYNGVAVTPVSVANANLALRAAADTFATEAQLLANGFRRMTTADGTVVSNVFVTDRAPGLFFRCVTSWAELISTCNGALFNANETIGKLVVGEACRLTLAGDGTGTLFLPSTNAWESIGPATLTEDDAGLSAFNVAAAAWGSTGGTYLNVRRRRADMMNYQYSLTGRTVARTGIVGVLSNAMSGYGRLRLGTTADGPGSTGGTYWLPGFSLTSALRMTDAYTAVKTQLDTFFPPGGDVAAQKTRAAVAAWLEKDKAKLQTYDMSIPIVARYCNPGAQVGDANAVSRFEAGVADLSGYLDGAHMYWHRQLCDVDHDVHVGGLFKPPSAHAMARAIGDCVVGMVPALAIMNGGDHPEPLDWAAVNVTQEAPEHVLARVSQSMFDAPDFFMSPGAGAARASTLVPEGSPPGTLPSPDIHLMGAPAALIRRVIADPVSGYGYMGELGVRIQQIYQEVADSL